MSFPGFPDQRAKAFTDGWLRYSAFAAPSDVYWDPRTGAWVTYRSTDHTISDVGIPSPDVKFQAPAAVFERVEQSWSAIKGQHPSAVFDPRATAWRVITSRSPSPTPSNGDLARRMELAKPELDALDREYQAGVLNAEEWERRRQEVRRKYQLE